MEEVDIEEACSTLRTLLLKYFYPESFTLGNAGTKIIVYMHAKADFSSKGGSVFGGFPVEYKYAGKMRPAVEESK